MLTAHERLEEIHRLLTIDERIVVDIDLVQESEVDCFQVPVDFFEFVDFQGSVKSVKTSAKLKPLPVLVKETQANSPPFIRSRSKLR